jgi:hypothetical protein
MRWLTVAVVDCGVARDCRTVAVSGFHISVERSAAVLPCVGFAGGWVVGTLCLASYRYAVGKPHGRLMLPFCPTIVTRA